MYVCVFNSLDLLTGRFRHTSPEIASGVTVLEVKVTGQIAKKSLSAVKPTVWAGRRVRERPRVTNYHQIFSNGDLDTLNTFADNATEG